MTTVMLWVSLVAFGACPAVIVGYALGNRAGRREGWVDHANYVMRLERYKNGGRPMTPTETHATTMTTGTPISPFARLWAAIQRRPHPPREWGRYKRALTSWKVGYAEVLRAAPRPVIVNRTPAGHWRSFCRLCGESCPYPDHTVATHGGLDHLHTHHGCPNRHTTGEPCHDTCVHCRGWQWCAAPTTERSDW